MLNACRNIYAFTDIFTSLREKIPGWKSSSFKNLLHHGMTGTRAYHQNVTALTQHHGYSMTRAIFAKSATTIHA